MRIWDSEKTKEIRTQYNHKPKDKSNYVKTSSIHNNSLTL